MVVAAAEDATDVTVTVDERVDTDTDSDALLSGTDATEELADTLELEAALDTTVALETVDTDATLESVDKEPDTDADALPDEKTVERELLDVWASAERARRRAHKAESLVLRRRAMSGRAVCSDHLLCTNSEERVRGKLGFAAENL